MGFGPAPVGFRALGEMGNRARVRRTQLLALPFESVPTTIAYMYFLHIIPSLIASRSALIGHSAVPEGLSV